MMHLHSRALAFQCNRTHKAFDQILTVYLKGASENALDNENVSFCGVQVTNRKRDQELKSWQGKMDARRAGIQISPQNPYLALRLSLQSCTTKRDQQVRREQYRLPSSDGVMKDRKQASLVFRGLESFHFFSPAIKSSLAYLIDLRLPILKLHEHVPLALKYVRRLIAPLTAS